METTKLGNVSVAQTKLKSAPFNGTRNIYGSLNFGEVGVYQAIPVDGDTHLNLKPEVLTYLASIVSPAYSNVKLEFWNYFVAYNDLYRNYAGLMSQTNVQRSAGLFTPTKVPYAPRNLLSLLFLFGAHCTVYRVETNYTDGKHDYWHPMGADAAGLSAQLDFYNDMRTFINNALGINFSMSSSTPVDNLFGFKSYIIDARVLVDFNIDRSEIIFDHCSFGIPLSNQERNSFFTVTSPNYTPAVPKLDQDPVSIDGADFLIERTFVYNNESRTYAFAFRMHSFGLRLYKALKGVEFQEDFTDPSNVSLSPFFAIFKAYYDIFGILLYRNWENTACAKLLNLYDERNLMDFVFGFVTNINDIVNSDNKLIATAFQQFIKDLGSMFITSSQDFASMLTRSVGVSSPVDSVDPHQWLSTFPDPRGNNLNLNSSAADHIRTPSDSVGADDDTNAHAVINNVIHSYLDSKLLMRMYLTTNRKTIAGQRVEQQLRLQGLGAWVDAQKPRFISHGSIQIDFSKVLSQSDTYKDGEGAILGERGGYAEGYGYLPSLKYHNDESGIVITLCAVVPSSGLTQVMSPMFDCLKKTDFYDPNYDSMGQQWMPLKYIVGALPHVTAGDHTAGEVETGRTMRAFGLGPRESQFKVLNNVINGAFARCSKRNYFLTYMLDKVIPLGIMSQSKFYEKEVNDVNCRYIEAYNQLPIDRLPLAGEAWRYPTRYPWLGMLTRIFANLGDSFDKYTQYFSSGSNSYLYYEYVNNEDDGFYYLTTSRGVIHSRKLPLADSFETEDEDFKANTSVSKA